LTYIADGATAFLYSWNRITFIELMGEVPGAVAVAASTVPQGTSVLGFFRDDDR
jgi:hypothetical protein